MIRVCDAIMGSGKTTATIAYMNAHKDDRFIYITPYLDEATRIKESCPDLNFVEPSVIREYGNRKRLHTEALIREGRNIATTHQAFKMYTREMKRDIHKNGYTLFIDESVDMLTQVETDPGDIQMAIDAGYIDRQGDEYVVIKDGYTGSALAEVYETMKSRTMTRLGDDKDMFFWRLPPDLLSCFKDVFILTYLFEGQGLHHMLVMNNLEYEKIGIKKTDGGLVFGGFQEYVPEYVSSLCNMIDIYEGKLNKIGDEECALSKTWMERHSKGSSIRKLKNNIYNYFRNLCSDAGGDRRLWSTHKKYYEKLKGRGFANAFTPFNIRATNAYRDRDVLVYAINVYMNVGEKLYYQTHNVQVDEDMFALSTMVQWIWRSAIRDGKKVRIYIPSKRMRTLLNNWIDSLTNGGNKDERTEV